MANWRDLAAAVSSPKPAPVPQSAQPDDGLPDALREGLRRLAFRRPPTIQRPDVWQGIVSDAEYLARDRWAAKALALGWDAHDLFGVGPDDSDQYESLAVWLDGRKVAAIGGMSALTVCGAMFLREAWGHATSPKFEPVFLWDWKAARR